MWGDNDRSVKAMIGHVVVDAGDEFVKLDNGKTYQFNLEGDCCSSSYFTTDALEEFKSLIGRKILDIEFVSESSSKEVEEKYPEGDVLEWHFIKIKTDQGDVTLDWRNDSNGYYGGWCDISEHS